MKKVVFAMVISILVLCAVTARAQDTSVQPTQPINPDQPIANPGEQQLGQGGQESNVIPAIASSVVQSPPLGGALQASPFGLPPEHSYISPTISIFNTVNTNGGYLEGGTGSSQLVTMTNIMGGVTIQKVGHSDELTVNYLGGRSFSSDGQIFNSTTQLFGFSNRWAVGRWGGGITDQLSYSSEPFLSGGGFGIPGLGVTPGLGASSQVGLQPSYVPNSSVAVPTTPLLDNSSVVELDYRVSPRGTFSVTGSYLLTHYFGDGLINSNDVVTQASYTYQLSAKDTIAATYMYNTMHFGGAFGSVNEQVPELSYRRQLTSRLSFQATAGPEATVTLQPGNPNQSSLSWLVNSSLTYKINRTTRFNFMYAHMLTAGSGVFAGSQTDAATFGTSNHFSRNWTANYGVSYTRNTPIDTFGTLPGQTYDSLNATAGISRLIGQVMTFSINYTGTYQTSGETACIAGSCGSSLTNNSISAGFSWHPRAVSIE